MVDPDAVHAGLFRSTDDVEDSPSGSSAPTQPSRLPIKRIAVVSAAVAATALLVSAAVYGPTVVRVFGQNDTTMRSPDRVASFTLDKSDDAKNTAEYIRDA